jgi:hypothetical protein
MIGGFKSDLALAHRPAWLATTRNAARPDAYRANASQEVSNEASTRMPMPVCG